MNNDINLRARTLTDFPVTVERAEQVKAAESREAVLGTTSLLVEMDATCFLMFSIEKRRQFVWWRVRFCVKGQKAPIDAFLS